MLQASTVVRDALDPGVCHQRTALHAQLLQIGTVAREQFESDVGDVALADVQRPKPGAGPGKPLDSGI